MTPRGSEHRNDRAKWIDVLYEDGTHSVFTRVGESEEWHLRIDGVPHVLSGYDAVNVVRVLGNSLGVRMSSVPLSIRDRT